VIKYGGLSKSFWTELIKNKQQQQTLVEKQHKGSGGKTH